MSQSATRSTRRGGGLRSGGDAARAWSLAEPLLTAGRAGALFRRGDPPSRSVSVELGAHLRFEMLEALAQPRPSQWARVWPTSVALSRWLLAQAPTSLASHATELGCGMGLVSVTLAHLGVITLGTDREPLALAFATENAARNGVSGFSAGHLDWGEPTGASTQLLVASDVAYEAEAPQRLLALIDGAGLLGAGGRLVLGVPRARAGLALKLVSELRARGYAHHQQHQSVAWEGRVEGIALHVLTRRAALSEQRDEAGRAPLRSVATEDSPHAPARVWT